MRVSTLRTARLLGGVAAIAGCGKSASSQATGCKVDTDCKGDRICVSGQCTSPGAAAVQPTPGAAGGSAAAVPESGAAPNGARVGGAAANNGTAGGATVAAPDPSGGGTSCEQALSNSYAVVEASGVESLKEASRQNPVEASIAACNEQRWPEDVKGCLAAAKTVDDIYGDCYVRPLKNRPLTIVRTIPLQNQKVDPPLFSQDGDYLEIEKGCGVLFVDPKPGQALFLMCNGETRGPLNTPDQVKELFAGLSAQSQRAHETTMSILRRMPSGRFGGWKVCDQAGNCRIE
jgi:hypothetical protein